MSTSELFAAYEVNVGNEPDHVPGFFIESTAPNNIDDKDGTPLETPKDCSKLASVEVAIDRIADQLAQQQQPKLVLTVHGFNSPRETVINSFAKSFKAAIRNRGLVCVSYRWPSEHMGTPWLSGWSAAPVFLLGLLVCALAAVYVVNFQFELCSIPKYWRIFITAVTSTMAVIPITLFLLRLLVYFRDQYRATTYGVPDLVDIVRLIDQALQSKFENKGGQRVDLSFIGHSMGGFVVTNTVRILSDVFSPYSPGPKTRSTAMTAMDDQQRNERSKIGKAFQLRRLVLVSPDIPAEILMSGRANALRSSVERFQEAHLFSNEADEVLRNISTTGNFFALPTTRRTFGYRLGNVGVLAPWGITPGLTDVEKLRLGSMTLAQLHEQMGFEQSQASTAQRFTYFDCTDSVDQGVGVVSYATPGQSLDLSMLGHLRQLWYYVTGKCDVHSGYFASDFAGSLIYRFACIGYQETEQAYGDGTTFSAVCREHQIKALRN
jgi:pimeloyl-ACP methyl ester carboxylesterase